MRVCLFIGDKIGDKNYLFYILATYRLSLLNMTLNEANTRKQLIDRSLESIGWKDEYLYCEYTFTDGKKTPADPLKFFEDQIKNMHQKLIEML